MKFIAKLKNTKNQREYGASFKTDEERQEYIDRTINKKSLAENPSDFEVTKIDENNYGEKRLEEYFENGLTLEKFLELLIENDNAGMAKFRSDRDAIRGKHPKK